MDKRERMEGRNPDQPPRGLMQAEFFFNIYGPLIAAGRTDAAEMMRQAHELGIISYPSSQPEDVVHPSEMLVKIDLARLETMVNQPPKTSEQRNPSRIRRFIARIIPHRGR